MSTEESREYNFVDDKNAGTPITASRVDGEFDNIIAALNQKVIIKSTAPASPINGMLWLDSTTKLLKQYRNSEWVVMGIVHVSTTAPTTMKSGDVWVDTSGSENVIKVRNNANDGWLVLYADATALNPSGAMMMWPTDTAPTGWLLCYGQAVSRTTYAALFAVVSTTFGVGDGSTTFNLPDFRGRIPLGQDDMGGVSADVVTAANADTLGGEVGSEEHTLTVNEMPSHGHPYRHSQNPGGSSDNNGGLMTDNGTSSNRSAFSGTPSDTAGEQIGGTGGGAAHANLQPSLTVNMIIKT